MVTLENQMYQEAAEYYRISHITIKKLIEKLNLSDNGHRSIMFNESWAKNSEYSWRSTRYRFDELVRAAENPDSNLKHYKRTDGYGDNKQIYEHIFAIIPIPLTSISTGNTVIPDNWSIIIASKNTPIDESLINISKEKIKWLGKIDFYFSQYDNTFCGISQNASLSVIHFEINNKPITFFVEPDTINIGGITFGNDYDLQPPKSALLGFNR